jgi:hypothetical protein
MSHALCPRFGGLSSRGPDGTPQKGKQFSAVRAPVTVWAALHGLATLLAAVPSDFPWPDHKQMLTTLVGRLAQVTP